jgi:hypothetical protein
MLYFFGLIKKVNVFKQGKIYKPKRDLKYKVL